MTEQKVLECYRQLLEDMINDIGADKVREFIDNIESYQADMMVQRNFDRDYKPKVNVKTKF